MKANFSPFVQKEILKIRKKNGILANKIIKQIGLFEVNPIHPSLRTHKLTGKYSQVWSISITMSIRMLYRIEEDGSAYFIDIGSHEEVYEN